MHIICRQHPETLGHYSGCRQELPGREQREKTQRHQITAWGALAEFAERRLGKGTGVEITARIDQQSWGEGESRQYKTVLIANEIVLVRSPLDASDVGEAPAPAADDTAQPAADAATTPALKRRRAKAAA